jgi:uncharacterized protein YcfL
MKVVLFIILVVLLVGCSAFEEKLRQDQQLVCSPSYETLCAGWHI